MFVLGICDAVRRILWITGFFYQFILYIKKNINAHDRVKNVLKLVER